MHCNTLKAPLGQSSCANLFCISQRFGVMQLIDLFNYNNVSEPGGYEPQFVRRFDNLRLSIWYYLAWNGGNASGKLLEKNTFVQVCFSRGI